MSFVDETRVLLVYQMPLAETVASDFHDRLKSVSHGYASFDYEESSYMKANIVKFDCLSLLHSCSHRSLGGGAATTSQWMPYHSLRTRTVRWYDAVIRFVLMCSSAVQTEGRDRVLRLRETLDRQMFDIIIQAAVDGKVRTFIYVLCLYLPLR